MRGIFQFNSLNKRLVTVFLFVTIIPLIITVSIIYFFTEKGFNHLIQSQQENAIKTVESHIHQTSSELLSITKLHANDPEIIDAYKSEDPEKMVDVISPVFHRMKTEHHMRVFELGDENGIVVFRAHNILKYGDDKSGIEAVQDALSGKIATGFEFGTSGLSVRAFAPVMEGDKVIGTLQTGLDDTFVKMLVEMLPNVTINLYNNEGTVVLSSKDANLGNTLDDQNVIRAVREGQTVTRNDHQIMHSYLPMLDPTKSEVIGIIGISQDFTVINKTKNSVMYTTAGIIILTIITVSFVTFFISRSVTKPVEKVAKYMLELADGNLSLPVEDSNRKDEIGTLVKAMKNMQQKLRNTLSYVARAAADVSAQSEELTQSANEVSSGAQQISSTMQEIAAGAEKQSHAAGDLSSLMGDLLKNVQDVNEKGNHIRNTSENVLQNAGEGKQLMASSHQQMEKIDDLVRNSVMKMQALENETKEISKLVSIIKEIAKQTNLLALNAAIEAAQAGEHGRGFGVVAREVWELAGKVDQSVSEITEIVKNVQMNARDTALSLENGYEEVIEGTEQIDETTKKFNNIFVSVNEMTALIQTITEKIGEITERSKEVNTAIEEIGAISAESTASIQETAAISEESSASMEEVAESADHLAKLSENLNQLVHKFKF